MKPWGAERMTRSRIASSDLATERVSPSASGDLRKLTSGLLRAVAAIAMAAAVYAVPTAARANCDVPETPNGIPEDVAFKADVGGTRAALAKAGIGVGGAYYAEPFYNWGGFDEGGEYQGVLELYVNADMNKLGLWKGLCFYANGYQIHGNSITAANIGSLMPVSSLEATDATRLFELWFEQTIIKDKLSVRIRAARGRRGVHPQRWRRLFHQRHLGLAVDHRRRPAERRPGLSSGHARRARRHQSEREDGAPGRRL